MATPFVKSNIFIFFISMSLVLTLALGVYASNRLLTHWLLVRGLENTFAPHQKDMRKMLQTLAGERSNKASALPGLRLTSNDEVGEAAHSEFLHELKNVMQLEGRSPVIQNATVIYPPPDGVPGEHVWEAKSINWYKDGSLESPDTLTNAIKALYSGQVLTAIPDTSWIGIMGPRAVIAYRPSGEGSGMPGLLILTSQSQVLSNLTTPIWSISAAIGGLCLVSVLFAGILLWMRFHDQVRTNRDIQYLAHHDALTGLPNRAVFNAQLAEALRLAQAKASNIGVMLIDVDKFKEINDTHGHGTGDVFLQIVGERLKSVFGNHLVARLSGDEFAVLLTSISDHARMTRLAADMITATEASCVIDSKDIKISLSIGIARATDGSWRSSRLLHCADLALYHAKHSGRSTFAWYTPNLDADAQKRKEIEVGLVKALKFDQFKLVYQPQYALRDGTLKGYEALIRWDHPAKGSIRPDIFIPVAEDTGLIEEIGTWVLNHACLEAALWEDRRRRVAVNVSPAQFIAGETQNRVAQALQNSRLDPSRLEIEITESLLISNTDAVIETLRQIHEIGVSIAMDDFGTGYSSLSYLSLFPFDKIKIDKAFIQNLGKDASTDAIVTSIVGLGRSLDVQITAEGVETEDQAILLSAAGCDLVQGYMFGKPDSVAQHEANYPIFPHNASGGFWFPQKQKKSVSTPSMGHAPKLTHYASLVKSVPAPADKEVQETPEDDTRKVI